MFAAAQTKPPLAACPMPDDVRQPEDSFPASIPSGRETNIIELKELIDKLTSQQNEVRRRAAHGGMTPGEAKEYDARRARISTLARRLLHLENADQ